MLTDFPTKAQEAVQLTLHFKTPSKVRPFCQNIHEFSLPRDKILHRGSYLFSIFLPIEQIPILFKQVCLCLHHILIQRLLSLAATYGH
jgi:hypothetical protein